jgi:hypothetical protein
MSVCKYCGQEAGWFREVHAECVALARRGCEVVTAAVASAVREGRPFPEVKLTLDQTVTRHGIPRDELHVALIAGWDRGAGEAGIQEPLSPDRHNAMFSFSGAVGITVDELIKTDGNKTAGCSLLLRMVPLQPDPLPGAA